MEEKTNYTIVGFIVLVLAIGLVTSMLWLSVGFTQKKYKLYTVYMHEAAGLNQDAPVKYNGVQVGSVNKIDLNKNDPRQVEILLNIEEGVPVTTSTYATLNSQGITGVTYIGLSASTSNLTPLRKMIGEPYPVIPAKLSTFNQLDSILKKVSEEVSDASEEIKRIFNQENAEHIGKILNNLDKFSTNIARVSHDFPAMAKEIRIGVDKFNRMAESLSKAGNRVSNTMSSGKNTLDKISQEALPPAVVLLRRLNAISANLEKVSSQMRQNPAVIIRGSKPRHPGPGE